MANENQFQASLIRELKERFPESIVMKLDPKYKQGVPDTDGPLLSVRSPQMPRINQIRITTSPR